MRKVLFKKWIDKKWKEGIEGIFLSWGLDTEDNSSYSVAIIEMPDGSIEMVHPSNFKFIEPSASVKTFEERVSELNKIMEDHCVAPNNGSDYVRGFSNGLYMASGIMEGKEPKKDCGD